MGVFGRTEELDKSPVVPTRLRQFFLGNLLDHPHILPLALSAILPGHDPYRLSTAGSNPQGDFLKDLSVDPLRHLGMTIRLEGTVAA